MIIFIIGCFIATLECVVILLTTSVVEMDLLGGNDSRTSRDAAFTQCLEHKPRDYILCRADGIARSGKRNR